jgi:hypothetical protein
VAVQEVRWGHGISPLLKEVTFVTDRMSYIILTGRWCDFALNVLATTEDKSDDVKDSLYEELDRFPKI